MTIPGRYRNSEAWLKRAEEVIPIGSQTFSKSRTQYPVGISPLFIEKASRSYVWDLDGNRYVDLVGALAAITLGYADKGMNCAIRKQLKKGISFSLPGKLEAEVSEKLVSLIPSAEMVRFAKNGSDATSAAVRLARAYTGRDLVLVCGYHGWQDWFIGSTSKNKGVPAATSELTKSFPYNDLPSLITLITENIGKVAAVIMEPMNVNFPNLGYLEAIRDLTEKNGIVLIFDETITGFRFSNGGAQELFGVTPDLSTFGKGIANGMPLSAIVGKREIMLEMEEIFFSGTFGGELLSLAAANYVIDKFMQEKVTHTLELTGERLASLTRSAIESTGLEKVLRISGHPSWHFLNWNDYEEVDSATIKTFFLQEIFSDGVLVLNSHNVNYSLRERDLIRVSDTYARVFTKLEKALRQKTIHKQLKVAPLHPLFKIR